MDDTRLIYRVEDARAEGPFEAVGCWSLSNEAEDAGLRWSDDEPFHAPRRGFPGPMNDKGLSRRWRGGKLYGYYFGCRSLRQLRQWFPDELHDTLARNGQRLTVYRAPRKAVAFGQKQVAFDPRHAERVETLHITALYI
jgi:hypothetical protein